MYSFFAWDVSTILFVVLAVFFCVALIDKLFFAAKRPNEQPLPKAFWPKVKGLFYFAFFLKFNKQEVEQDKPMLARWAVSFYSVVLLVFALRAFVVEPFQIPSNSMMPNLLTGDFILVNKFTYGIRLPVTNTKLIDIGQPKRGDIVVFRYPNYEGSKAEQGKDYIKRIIGLPGDEVVYSRDRLLINGEPMRYKKIGRYQGFESGQQMSGYLSVNEQIEDKQYNILLHPNRYSRETEPFVVPAGMYFVMGDNRAHSADSRFWGFVPEDMLIGKAFMIWFHWDETVKFSRLGLIDSE